MFNSENEKYKHLLLKTFTFIFFFIIGILIIRFVLLYLTPFLLAFFLSIAIEPLVQFLQKLHMKRGFAVLSSILFVITILISISIAAVTRIFVELSVFI